MSERDEEQVPGCLLQAGIQYPQKKVFLCGHCSNRSDMVGDLGKKCLVKPQE